MTQLSLPVLGTKWNTVPNPSTPKRNPQAPPSAEPDPRGRRVDAPSSEGDSEFPRRHAMPPPAAYVITATSEQLRLAGDEPTRGWPAYSFLFPDGNPSEVIHEPVFSTKNYLGVAADFGWVTGAAMDPLTSALMAA